MLTYLRNLLQLMLAPSRGWEDVAASTPDASLLVRTYLYPTIGLAAASVFVQMLYKSPLGFSALIVKALVVFAALFLTFLFAIMMFKTYFYKMTEGAPNEHNFTVVIAYSVALLSISTLVVNILPVQIGLNYLLPLAVALIMWKADIYLHVRQDSSFAYVLFAFVTTILPPGILEWLFDKLL